MNEKQIPKLVGAIVEHQKYFVGLPTEDATWAIKNPHEAIKLFVRSLSKRDKSMDRTLTLKKKWMSRKSSHDQISLWYKFYSKYFGGYISVSDLTDLLAPDLYSNPGRVVVICKGLTLRKVIKVMHTENIKICGSDGKSLVEDLDSVIVDNDRTSSEKAYSFCINYDTSMAEEEFAGVSANDLKKLNFSAVTLLERLVLGLFCFYLTGEHWDTLSSTLCAGSRLMDGSVPSVEWRRDKKEIVVQGYGADSCGGNLRALVVQYVQSFR